MQKKGKFQSWFLSQHGIEHRRGLCFVCARKNTARNPICSGCKSAWSRFCQGLPRYKTKMPKRSNYVQINGRMAHRVIFEDAHGPLPGGWVVHHINGIKDDNRLKNLLAVPEKVHLLLHEEMYIENCHYNREKTIEAVKRITQHGAKYGTLGEWPASIKQLKKFRHRRDFNLPLVPVAPSPKVKPIIELGW